MNTHGWGVVGVLAVLLIALPIGAAYAYSSMVTSSGNSISADAYSIDIYEGETSIGKSFGIPAFEKNGSAEISGYSLRTLGSGTVYAVCTMKEGHEAAWALIDSMTLTVGENVLPFGIIGTNTGQPSAEFSVTDGTPVDFSINIEFSDKESNDYDLTHFVGSEIKFIFKYSQA